MSSLPDYSHVNDVAKMRRLADAAKAVLKTAEKSGDAGWIFDAKFHVDVAEARLAYLEEKGS